MSLYLMFNFSFFPPVAMPTYQSSPFATLPVELVDKVARALPLVALVAFMCTSKKHHAIGLPILWSELHGVLAFRYLFHKQVHYSRPLGYNVESPPNLLANFPLFSDSVGWYSHRMIRSVRTPIPSLPLSLILFQCEYAFRRAITPLNLEPFRLRARHVLKLSLRVPGHLALFHLLAHATQQHFVFPRLRSLTIDVGDGRLSFSPLSTLSTLFAPTLVHLEIMNPYLLLYGFVSSHSHPHLRSLIVHGQAPFELDQQFVFPVHLRELFCRTTIATNIISHLASFAYLRKLHLTLPPSGVRLSTSAAVFPVLGTLSLESSTLDPVLTLIHALNPHRLHALAFYVPIADLGSLALLVTAISRFSNLDSIIIDPPEAILDPHPNLPYFEITVFQPFLAMSRLSLVRISYFNIRVTEGLAQAISASWPNLTYLSLSPYPRSLPHTLFPLIDLVHFVDRCPQLSSLFLDFWCDYVHPDRIPPLRTIDPSRSIQVCPPGTRFLARNYVLTAYTLSLVCGCVEFHPLGDVMAMHALPNAYYIIRLFGAENNPHFDWARIPYRAYARSFRSPSFHLASRGGAPTS